MEKLDVSFATKEFMKKFFETSGDGIAIVDERGNILRVNSAFANIYGHTEEELEDMHVSQLVCKEDLKEGFREKHLKMLSEGGVGTLEETTHAKKDGSKIFVERSYTMVKDEDGNIFGGLITLRDITNRKRLERELKESEEKYRNLFETANEGIIITDRNNQIINLNKRAEEILGYSREEVMEKPATIFMPAKYQKVDENAMKRIYSTGQSHTLGKTFEIEMVKKDGAEIPVEATYSVLKMGDDFTFTMIFRDISERKQLEGRLIQSERLNALGELASGVAHDFNNLLATILGRTQFLKFKLGSYQGLERRQSSKYLLDGLSIIEKAATDGAEAIRRIQEFTRITADTQSFTEVSINELLTDAIEYTRPLWKDKAENEGKKIHIMKHLSDTLLPVAGNPSELREVLTNIIKNSLDALTEGGSISFKTSLDCGFVVLSISDTGYGMSKQVKERIFEPFFTTKGPQRTGLGMSVSYGIIKRHLGDITVKSEEGKGTCVIIKLPVAQGIPEKKKITPPPSEEKKARILVIDDEEGVRKLLYELLETVGHDVVIASDGEEGLKLFKEASFNMVFTDLGMPGISGWEVAKKVKELNPQIPVTLVTGWGVQVDKEKMKTHGVDFIISKPFNIDQVIGLVQKGMLKINFT
jgi:PAS domain S-box-containing protein